MTRQRTASVAGSLRSQPGILACCRRTLIPAALITLYLLAGIGAAIAADSCPEPAPTEQCLHVLTEFHQPLSADPGSFVLEAGLLQTTLSGLGVTHIDQRLGSLPNILILTLEKDVITSKEKLGKIREALQGFDPLRLGGLDYFEPSVRWVPRAAPPNDLLFRDYQQSMLDQVNALAAWDRIAKIQHNAVTVAVVDTGIRSDHPDLRHEMWSGNPAHGKNFSSPLANDTDDHAGHGTNVACALAATSNNGEGVASIPWRNNIKLVIAKYADSADGGCTDELIKSIDYAATEANAPILNLSVGQNQCSVPLRRELELLRDNKPGTLLVAAVDDQHPLIDLDAPGALLQDYPTSYHLPNVIAVQAVDKYDDLSSSVYGRNSVHLAAPGEYIQTTGNDPNHNYVIASGTSLAAPLVSATAALISSFAPQWRHEQIRQYLVDSARNPACDLPDTPATDFSLCGKSQSGGVLNVDAATGAPVVLDTPLEGTHWSPGTTHQVHWHPLFITDLCPMLDLLVSTDDGVNWTSLHSYPPAPRTRDTGASITLPSNLPKSNSARIAVRCHNTAHLERWSDTFSVH